MDIDSTSIYRFPKEMGSLCQYCSNVMAQSSQRLFENGSLQRTSVQHSFELLYVITGYYTLCRELALVGYYRRRSKLRSLIN